MIAAHFVDEQRSKVNALRPKVNLVNPCSVQNGIVRLSADEQRNLATMFLTNQRDMCFFIPASGSGSRMFEFLYDFFKHSDEDNRMKVERFLNHLNDFAFSTIIDEEVKMRLENGEMSLKEFAVHIVEDSGLGLGSLPKGLIPFHQYAYFVLNPFQEHVLQVCKAFTDQAKIHFTVNYDFKEAIAASIDAAIRISSFHPKVSFSEQNRNTDSLVFKEDGTLYLDDEGSIITRPAGHGALLENLNAIDSRYVFIKNIDNIQHLSLDSSNEVFATLGGLLVQFNEQLSQIWDAPRGEKMMLLKELNAKYKLFYREGDIPSTEEEINNWLLRPKRVCGMVRNEGQPGGGPFWVDLNGKIDKQIIEKTQIADDSEQLLTLVKSTHFNPVMLVCDTHNVKGEKLDLLDFQDAEQYMVVEKKINGDKVRFLEKPGLWNGSMANWISVFVEIPSACFSPVKDVLNLLDSKHIGQ